MVETKKLTAADIEAIAERCRNWGRWGDDDQLGTLNFIDADAVKKASALVRTGKVISCALPYDSHGPMNGSYGRNNPILLMMQDGLDAACGYQDDTPGLQWADDAVYMPLQSGTQWDALSHIFYKNEMYNGYPATAVSSRGATKGGVENYRDKVVGRGVFLDIARFRGVDWLEPGYGISGDELEAAAAAVGLTIGRGDIVLVRTGAMGRGKAEGWGDYAGGDAPGLDLSAAEWLFQKEVAAVATDTWGMEVRPNQTDEIWQPLHVVLIVNAGMLVGEIFDFEELAADCAGDDRYEFLFVAPPLPFTGAVGGPLNPVAIK